MQSADSVERLDSDERRAEIVSHPKRGTARRVVDVHATDVRGLREQILDGLTRVGVHPYDVVVVHAAAPREPRIVENRVVDVGPRSSDRPFLKLLGSGVEHRDPVASEFSEPQAVLRVHVTSTRA